MIFSILLAKNYKQGGGRPIYPIKSHSPNIQSMYTINDLSSEVSESRRYPRTFLTTSLKSDGPFRARTCKDFQTTLFDDDLTNRNPALKSFFQRFKQIGLEMPMDYIHKYLITYQPSSVMSGYHEYFLQELRVPQQKELLDICLGLDVYLGEFYNNELIRLGISRHHPERDRPYYYIFQIDDMTGDWRVKLIPLKWEGHQQLHGLMPKYEYYENNDLVVARFTHLAELILKRLCFPGTDYNTLFMKEFRNKVGKVGGNNVKIWEGVQDDRLEEWIK